MASGLSNPTRSAANTSRWHCFHVQLFGLIGALAAVRGPIPYQCLTDGTVYYFNELTGETAVVEPPGTPYLPANLPATPPEWSSNSDDSE